MTTIRTIRTLFMNGIIILLILVVLVEVMTWSIGGEAKLNFVKENGGVLSYFGFLIRSIILPELATVLVLALLMSWIHRWINPRLDSSTWKSLLRYQLSFLPVLLIAFLIFIPFTQSVRYLLVEFPTYSFNSYWRKHIKDSYSLALYFQYLFPVVLIGYGILNMSLVTGTLRNRRLTV